MTDEPTDGFNKVRWNKSLQNKKKRKQMEQVMAGNGDKADGAKSEK